MNAAKTLGDRLREARVAARLSQEELATLCGVSKATVSDWERGRMNPRVEQLPTLRQTLMTSLDKLICGDPFEGVRKAFGVRDGEPIGYVPAPDIKSALRANAMRGLFVGLPEAQQEAFIDLLKTMQPASGSQAA